MDFLSSISCYRHRAQNDFMQSMRKAIDNPYNPTFAVKLLQPIHTFTSA